MPNTLPKEGFIRLAVLINFIPFSKSTIWRKVKNKTFPAPVKLSENVTAWKAESIHEWMEEKGMEA